MKRYWAYAAGSMLAIMMAVGGDASARGLPAFAAQANDPNTEWCFQLNSGTEYAFLNNINCGPTMVSIPLTADSNGAKTVNIAVNSPNNQTWCRSVAEARDGTHFTSSNYVAPGQFNTLAALILTGASQVNQGLLLVECQVAQGARLIQVDWNN
jgi:hypothetical protein